MHITSSITHVLTILLYPSAHRLSDGTVSVPLTLYCARAAVPTCDTPGHHHCTGVTRIHNGLQRLSRSNVLHDYCSLCSIFTIHS